MSTFNINSTCDFHIDLDHGYEVYYHEPSMGKKILFGVALIEAIIIILLILFHKNDTQNTHNAVTCVSTPATEDDILKAFGESGTREDMLTVSRNLTLADNTIITANLDVICAKIYRQYKGQRKDGACDIVNELTLYGPFHQKMSDEQLNEHHEVPLLSIEELHGSISYELAESGEMYIQIESDGNSSGAIKMKLNLRKKDKNGQEWELVWRPFTGDEAQSSHDTLHFSGCGGALGCTSENR